MKLYKYIGETSRSTFERSNEHLNDMHQIKPTSHLLRHILDRHGGENMNEVRFGMKIIQHTRSSFERQLLESVCIQQNRHHNILNSRSEYNRCSIPRLSTKLGDQDFKKYEKEMQQEVEKEERLGQIIRDMRKARNKRRKPRSQNTEPAQKRRKTGSETSAKVYTTWDCTGAILEDDTPLTPREEKRKEENLTIPAPKRKKLCQNDIRKFLTHPATEQLPPAIVRLAGSDHPIPDHVQQLPSEMRLVTPDACVQQLLSEIGL